MTKFRAWVVSRKRFEQIQQLVWHKDDLTRVITSHSLMIQTNLPEDVILMQSTGLFDRNGVEIFEGDLLKMDDGSKRLIKVEAVESGNFAVKVFLSTKQSAYIAGNIHEHPHLVEGGG